MVRQVAMQTLGVLTFQVIEVVLRSRVFSGQIVTVERYWNELVSLVIKEGSLDNLSEEVLMQKLAVLTFDGKAETLINQLYRLASTNALSAHRLWERFMHIMLNTDQISK